MKVLGNLMDLFALTSGYKINMSKFVLMGLNITPETKVEVATLTIALWSSRVK